MTTLHEIHSQPAEQIDLPAKDALLTVNEVAARLRVDDTTVRRWIKNGILDAILLPCNGRRQSYRIKSSTLSTLLQASMAYERRTIAERLEV